MREAFLVSGGGRAEFEGVHMQDCSVVGRKRLCGRRLSPVGCIQTGKEKRYETFG